MGELFPIIHEDDELLVINKPAGLVCHPSKTGEMSSLIGRVRLHLGNGARPHLLNRLDRETSGVTLVAKTDESARELRRLWESRQVEKEYLAIVHGEVAESEGVIEAALGKDEQSRVAVKDCVRADGLAARTEFKVERRFQCSVFSMQYSVARQSAGDQSRMEGAFSLLRVRLRTGRKHQIRIHLAHIGHPVVGDKLYGGDEDLYLALVENRLTPEQWRRLILPHQALHANRVRFERRGKEAVFSAEPEDWFMSFLKEKP